MPKKKRGPWTRHDGAEGEKCPTQGGQRVQVRPIGASRAYITRAGELDWSQKFDWRMA